MVAARTRVLLVLVLVDLHVVGAEVEVVEPCVLVAQRHEQAPGALGRLVRGEEMAGVLDVLDVHEAVVLAAEDLPVAVNVDGQAVAGLLLDAIGVVLPHGHEVGRLDVPRGGAGKDALLGLLRMVAHGSSSRLRARARPPRWWRSVPARFVTRLASHCAPERGFGCGGGVVARWGCRGRSRRRAPLRSLVGRLRQ